jgi:hypothetical protein
MDYEFIKLEQDEHDICNADLKAFEKIMSQTYSLGKTEFRIDHGEDYFAFFKKLGTVEYFVIRTLPEEIIIGTFCAVLRHYPVKVIKYGRESRRKIPFWYFCDLKIHKDHRGQNLALKLFETIFEDEHKKWNDRAYMISMDPGSQQIVNLMSKFDKYPIEYFTLRIYSLNRSKMFVAEKILKRHFSGPISYATNSGTKNLIIAGSDIELNLYHLQHGQFAVQGCDLDSVEPHAIIMFCVPENTNIYADLTQNEIHTDITATVLHWNIQHFNWGNILTSEI